MGGSHSPRSIQHLVVSVTPDTTGGSVAHVGVRVPARLTDESENAYARFCAYCAPADGQARTFASVGRQFGVSPDSIKSQAERFAWRQRCLQWERNRVEAAALKAGELAAGAGRDALALCKQLRDRVATISAELDEETDPRAVLASARDAAWVLDKLVKTERLILGLSTQNQSVIVTEQRAQPPRYDLMTDDEMRYVELAERACARVRELDGCS